MRHRNRYIETLGAVGLSLGLCAFAAAMPARADDASAGSTVGRVSVLHGDVTMQRGDSGGTVAAVVNAPVTVGDYLSTAGQGSRAEVQLDAADYVRVDSGSQLRFTQLDSTQETVQLAAGTIEVRMFKADVDPQVDTPSITIRPDVAGEYRVSVASDGSTTFTVRSGSADLVWPQGTQTVNAGLTVAITGASTAPVIRPIGMVSYDGFDSWNAQRDQYIAQAPSATYVNANMIGVDDLSSYGHWVYEGGYGNVWVPYAYAVGPGWAPYHNGRWAWEPYYGWTWVGYEPWGWAPYHYGRWFYAAPYGWAWSPGPVYARPVYRPALVAFFGLGTGGSSLNLAYGNVGWVPLAPYEPYHPWWGPGYYNRSFINVTTVDVTRVYRNTTVVNGVAVISHDNFTSGGTYRYLTVRQGDLHSVALVRGIVPVVPTRQNLSFTKVDAGHSAAGMPLSTHFSKLPAPAKLPPSFDEQRTALESATLREGTAPASGGSAWDRFSAGRASATGNSEAHRITDSANGSEHKNPHPSSSHANGKQKQSGPKHPQR